MSKNTDTVSFYKLERNTIYVRVQMVCYSSCPVTCIAVKMPQKIFEKFIDNPNNDIINMGFVEKEVIYFLNDWKNEFITNYYWQSLAAR